MNRPIAVTLGDPAGIGPEIIVASARALNKTLPIRVYGSRAVLDWTAREVLGTGPFDGDVVDVLDEREALQAATPGVPSPAGARLQYQALLMAIDDTLAGRTAAVVTAPWTKWILTQAGLPPTGHTEVLAERTQTPEPTMMLCGDLLRVALATTHLPLARVPESITVASLLHHLGQLDGDLRRRFAIENPRIAVCGLNPHAGEGGIMGSEERDAIAPAISQARARGIDVEGPFPADTLFPRVVRHQRFDAVLAMYHDQGLVPLKLWHFGESANVTLGLPIIRTSVDHGTAYDIAGQGVADPSSLLYAIRLAARMVDNEA